MNPHVTKPKYTHISEEQSAHLDVSVSGVVSTYATSLKMPEKEKDSLMH